MTIDPRAPERAPVRSDLTWLRHRSRVGAGASRPSAGGGSGPGPVSRPGSGTGSAAPRSAGGSALADFVAGRSTARRPAPAAAARPPAVARPAGATPPVRPAASSSLDLSAPGPGTPPAPAPSSPGSLDLFGPSAEASTPAGSLSLAPPDPAPVTPRPGSTSLDLDAPTPSPGGPPPPSPGGPPAPSPGSTSLDLGGPPAAPPRPAAAPSGSTSLDLGAAPLRPVPGGSPAGSTSLDLGGPAAGPASSPGAGPAPAPAGLRRPDSTWVEPRITAGVPTTLSPRRPTVTLNRVQSGVGTLTFEAVVTAAAGDLRLGCAYQLRSGRASTVQHQAGRRYGPPGETRRPILVATRAEYERIAVDLRQIDDLERLVVYAFSGDGRPLQWGGTLIATTFGGDRVEMPIDLAPAPAVAVLTSVYNVGGELVVRSEMDLIAPTIRDACRGYGFDRISWVDDATPID